MTRMCHKLRPLRQLRRSLRRGFTLLESCLALIIIGVGITAAMQLFAACTSQNRAAINMTTAMLLAQNIQETMAGLPLTDPAFGPAWFPGLEPGQSASDPELFDDIDDFNAQSFSPPIDSLRQPIPNLAEYAQVVAVWPVQPNNLSINTNTTAPDLAQTTYTGAVRVTVRVLHRNNPTDIPYEVYRTSWIRVAEE